MKKLLVPGFEFTSKWFVGIIKVLSINNNDLFVRITRSTEHYHDETWNLEHTIIGFGNRDYKPLEVEV